MSLSERLRFQVGLRALVDYTATLLSGTWQERSGWGGHSLALQLSEGLKFNLRKIAGF